MRTIVREAYDTRGLPSTVLGPVLALTRRLRAGGLPVSTGESIDAVRALAQVDPGRRVQVREALRASLVKDPAHDDVFALAFEAVFLRPRDRPGRDPEAPPRRSSGVVRGDDTTDLLADAITAGDNAEVNRLLDDAVDRWAGEPDGRSVEHHVQRVLRGVDLARLYRRVLQPDPGADTLQRNVGAAEANARMEEIRRRIEALVAASLGDLVRAPPAQPDALEDTPLLRAGPDELASLRSTVRPLARRLATRLGRKARRRGHGTLDMRRTPAPLDRLGGRSDRHRPEAAPPDQARPRRPVRRVGLDGPVRAVHTGAAARSAPGVPTGAVLCVRRRHRRDHRSARVVPRRTRPAVTCSTAAA